MREDHSTICCRRVAEAHEFLHQIGIGQAVKTVALNSFGVETARDGQQLRDPRHGLVKCGVKTGHLGQFGITLAERLDQLYFAGQMIGVVRTEAMQFGEQFRGDPLRLGMLQTMHHAVAHGADGSEIRLLLEPINQEFCRRLMIGGGEAAAVLPLLPGEIVVSQGGSAQADAVNLSRRQTLQWFVDSIQRELDAR